LMELKRDKTIVCVLCKTNFARQFDPQSPELVNLVPISTANTTQTITPTVPRTEEKVTNKEEVQSAPPVSITETPSSNITQNMQSAKPISKNDVSKKIGEYLIRGWTMLQEHCPNCIVPLMKKEEKMMCVACGCTIIRPEEFDPTKHKIMNKPEQATPAPTPSSLPQTQPESHPVKDIEPPRHPVKQQQPVSHDSHSLPIKKRIAENADQRPHDVILNNSLSSLYSKLDECQQRLQSASIEESISLCTLINKCAKTITTLEDKVQKRKRAIT